MAAWKNGFEVPPRAVRRILGKVIDGPTPEPSEVSWENLLRTVSGDPISL